MHFCHGLVNHVGAHLQLGVQLLDPSVLAMQLLDLGHHRRVPVPKVLRYLEKKTARTPCSRHRSGKGALGLLEQGIDSAAAEMGLLHGICLEHAMRKFHFWRTLFFGGMTHPHPQPETALANIDAVVDD